MQLQEGDIVDVTFLKSQKHLTSMQLAQTAWQYEDVEHYEMNTVRNEVAIGEEVFQLSKDTQYFSQGHSIEKMDLNPADILTFHGIDSTVLSVTVEKGHGYLRLVNDENFVGGWLEIGQTQIVRITEDMLVTVPEGSYQVDISYNGGGRHEKCRNHQAQRKQHWISVIWKWQRHSTVGAVFPESFRCRIVYRWKSGGCFPAGHAWNTVFIRS